MQLPGVVPLHGNNGTQERFERRAVYHQSVTDAAADAAAA